ncbi:MAG: SLC13/DASS family transporter [Acidimicrobiia bacterium]|nr:SLC13/DASS family transporter [Acidimicrobiia bacterium]
MSETDERRVSSIGRWAGPIAAVVVWFIVPESATAADGTEVVLGSAGRATASIAVLMAVWWMTEAISIPATALIPIVAFPLLGVATIEEAAAPYANPLIYLFLGGFAMALAMQRWGLERRIALVALRAVGTRPTRLIGGFMVVTALLSMWVSNTATAAMMLPVALSVVDAATGGAVRDGESLTDHEGTGARFATGLLLAIAVSASIGGVGTLIGSPPNLFLASFSSDELGVEISFAQWLLLGLPFVVILLPIAWWLIAKVMYQPDVGSGRIDEALARWRENLGKMSRAEITVAIVFATAVVAWITRPLLEEVEFGGATPFSGLSDGGIALAAAVALFVLPSGKGHRRVLVWEDTRRLPWGTLVLFGGGLSLAAAVDSTGVAALIGVGSSALGDLPPVLVVAAIVAVVVFLTELTSNTATVAALLPILAAAAPGIGLDPLLLAIPAALAGSLAFMLPVATPPNAIVFGSGHVALPDMARLGLRLNVVSIIVVTTLTFAIAVPLFGIGD